MRRDGVGHLASGRQRLGAEEREAREAMALMSKRGPVLGGGVGNLLQYFRQAAEILQTRPRHRTI